MKLSRGRYDGVFPHEPSELEAAALWRRIAESDRRRPRKRRRYGWGIAAAAAVLLAILGASLLRGGAEPAVTAALEPGLRLSDGSRVVSDPGTDLRVIESARERVALELVSGRATFDVAHLEGRAFSVRVRELVVRVVGTRFVIAVKAGQVRVEVERGRVEIDRPGAPSVTLGPGESFSAADSPPAEAPPAAAPSSAPSVAPRGSAPLDATALFDRAMAERRAGRTAAAIEAFERLQREFPDDPRARIAALAVARIRLDELDDPSGALRALDSQPDAGVGAEDALARRVEGYDRLRDQDRCRAARDEYLRTYPQGTHVAVVRGRCSAR